jgi:hypothetical protein
MPDSAPEYEIEFRWKEQVYYWEGCRGLLLDGGWGVQPPVTYVPSAAIWDSVVPVWARGRRETILRRLVEHQNHRVEQTDHYPWQVGVTR